MITREDLLLEIKQCQRDPVTVPSIEKLACMYIVYDHLYGDVAAEETSPERIVDIDGESDFARRVKGRKSADVWKVMDELMEVLRVTNERLYDQVLRKIEQ
jgi:hypothetical protein